MQVTLNYMVHPNPNEPHNDGLAPIVDTREIVRRHMADPNHVISEEELSQVTISTDHINVSEHPLVKALESNDDEESKPEERGDIA